ncbi:MAG: metal ABC transporter permease [Candidatus Bipolaricaulota bacterium]|nr:metal ABC transporter permease [Candidatus Bipolaricaulota bacterium]MCX7844845.1 metal ABC transporter permease [Candidatus Bipolaricaulota bacterium]MDW8151329.1 metal ABC transporter permease [Candidatus Bipolaricaulota bacterium]
MSPLDFFRIPLQHAFFVRAVLAAVCAAAACATVGTFLVLRGMTFFGDALAHAVLPGVALGYLLHRGSRAAVFGWALGTAVLASLGIGWVGRRGRLKEDTAIGIVFVGLFALGIGLISTVRGYAVDLVHFLFGNVLAVTPFDLYWVAGLSAGVILVVLGFYKELALATFDPLFARTLRLPTEFLRYLLLVLAAVTVVTALRVVGVALALAMLVVPPATGLLLGRRLPVALALALLFAVLSGFFGLFLSYYAGMAPGAAVVLVATAFFLLALLR